MEEEKEDSSITLSLLVCGMLEDKGGGIEVDAEKKEEEGDVITTEV